MGVLEGYSWKRIALVFIPLLMLMFFVFFISVENHEIEFPASIYVSDQPNFIDIKNEGGERDALDFGGISAGYAVEKFINLSIGKNAPPAKVSFKIEGNIKEFIEIPAGSFVIKEPTEVNIYARVPKGTDPGEYGGKVTVRYSLTLWRKFLNLFE